jgi:aerobic carbon-monoxide dehydrogenase large subunit
LAAHKGEGFGIGASVLRREDPRLVTGGGCFSDDVSLPGQAYAAIVRSPYAHARILGVHTGDALAAPGVLAVFTAEDGLADGWVPIPDFPWPSHPPDIRLKNSDGRPVFEGRRYPLAVGKVRFVGESVAMVVAETAALAADAAELVEVSYEPLPALATAMEALEAETLVWEEAGSNLLIDDEIGDPKAAEAACAGAAHVVSLQTQVPRVTAAPMEPRAVAAAFDASSGRYTVHTGTGGVVRTRREIAVTLGVALEDVRVIARDVGGNFGSRNALYPEYALAPWAARRLGRPVKWTADRREAFLTEHQARDLHVSLELALAEDGRFLAIRGVNTSNVGAHTISYIPLSKGVELMTSVYDIPAAAFRARAVASNSTPTAPYRSAGRPEVMFAIERLIDIAAETCGFDRVELRLTNLVRPEQMPHVNGLGMTYDSGDYPGVMRKAMALGDWDGFEARRAEAARRGRLRGIGVANYIETSSGSTREKAVVTARPDGGVDVIIGTQSSGQGHETSFAQLVHDWLGAPIEQIRILTGDTDYVTQGGGSHSGRSMRMAAIVVGGAVRTVIDKGRVIAAAVLGAPQEDITFAEGLFRTERINRTLSLAEVAAAALNDEAVPASLRGVLAAEWDETVPIAQFPYGSHVCEVEVDPETGVVEVVAYAAVDDVGRAVNPMIIHGQTHGGVAQGLGEALMEAHRHDSDSAQLLTGSMMDYGLPRAAQMPHIKGEISEVPSVTHPMGMRAGGEGGATPSPAAAINAVVHALSGCGVRHLEMPATPEAVWRALQQS